MRTFEHTGAVIDAGAPSIKPGANKVDLSTHRRLEKPREPVAIPADPPRGRSLPEAAYGVFQRLFALAVLLVSSPVMLVVAVLIKLDSPGPVLFAGKRTGLSVRVRGAELAGDPSIRAPSGGFQPDQYYWKPRIITFYKFRTMHKDANRLHPEHYWWEFDLTPEEIRGMYYKHEVDPRLTRIGQFLRKTSLDELPNFINVLTGEVALVGPRPEAAELPGLYTEEQLKKFTVKPGLTCLSKVHGRGELSVGEQLDWDLEYVRTRSLALDIKLIFQTAWMVITQRGSF